MKKIIVVLVILSICLGFTTDINIRRTNAENSSQWSWIKFYGGNSNEEISDVCSSNDGGLYLHGFTESFGVKGIDFLDVKLDKTGKPEWAIVMGGKNDEKWNAVANTSDGYVFTGTSNSYENTYGEVICRMKEDGSVYWSKLIKTGNEIFFGNITTNKNDDIFLTFSSGSNNQLKSGIIKLNKSGKIIWAKGLTFPAFRSSWLPAITIDKSTGNILVAGNGWDFNGKSKGIFLKFDENGKFISGKQFTKVGENLKLGYGLIHTDDGYITAGSIGNSKQLLLKVNINGNLLWAKTYYNPNQSENTIADVIKIKNGILINNLNKDGSGRVSITYTMLDFQGKPLWTKLYKKNEIIDFKKMINLPTITPTNDGAFAITQYIKTKNNGKDFLVIKTNTSGEIPGCNAIENSAIKSTNVTRQINSTAPNVLTKDFNFSMVDIDLNPRKVNLLSNTLCEPKPETPVLLSPQNGGAVGKSFTLHWSEAINSSKYEIQISTNTTFSNIAYKETLDHNFDKLLIGKDVKNSETFFWRVRGINELKYGDWSKTFSFVYKNSSNKIVIKLQPNNPYMIVNDIKKEIDPGRGTKPVIISEWGRTVVPIRAIVEALGGKIQWDGVERRVTIQLDDKKIELWIDNPQARVNGKAKWIDEKNHNVRPVIINNRTMLPLRFAVESLGCSVDWNAKTRTITITYQK